MKARSRSTSMLRTFRSRWGMPGLVLILLGQFAQLAEARNLIVTQGAPAASSGGIASSTANPVGAPALAGGLSVAQAEAQAARQIGDMTRAARLIVTQQNVQVLARAAAGAAMPALPVTEGLTTLGTTHPGLTPDSGLRVNQQSVSNPSLAPGTTTSYDVPTSWTGINGLAQTTSASTGTTSVTVSQNTTTAVLNWSTFNIGKKTNLQFAQSDPSWIAFNKVAPGVSPSQILGAINAPGQVYVINANGIVFGGAAQVNVHNLTASTLPINQALVNQGLLNNPDLEFLFSALATDADTQAQLPTSGTVGNIVVQPGAILNAPTNADNVGGRIVLIAPNVDNQGTIETPDGQTILTAGLEVGFLASANPSVRGLNTYVGNVASSAITTIGGSGNVSNEGLISSPRGNITLTGASIDQNGVVAATTSVAENGSIDLLAVYGDVASTQSTAAFFTYGPTGTVTFEPNSLTEVLPDYADTATIAGQIIGTSNVAVPVLALPSQILVQAATITMKPGTADQPAEIFAPNATVVLQAGTSDPSVQNTPVATLQFVDGTSSILIGDQAIIDVAGSADVAASVANNIVAVQLLGAQLADSPLQRSGPLRGQTINVDLGQMGTNANGTTFIGTPLANTLGYVNLVQYNVGELTTAGGTIAINTGGAVTLAPGSVLDVSGGYINYAGAEVNTTRLLTSTGQIVDVSKANPDVVYKGIYTGTFETTDANLGISNTFTNPLATGAYFEPGYVKGGNGGAVSIQAPVILLGGDLAGQTVAGPRQLTTHFAPVSSSLGLIIGESENGSSVMSSIGANIFLQQAGDALATAPAGFAGLPSTVVSPEVINNNGFNIFSVLDTEGSITVEPDARLLTQAGGVISLGASTITIDADIVAPGGTLRFTAQQVSQFNPQTNGIPNPPVLDPNKGIFTLAAGATLSTAGQVIDDRIVGGFGTTAGGSITITSYTAELAGGTLNVSGGLHVNADSTLSFTGASAGAIDIEAGQDPTYLSVLGGLLDLTNTTLLGYSGTTGGSLTVKAPGVQVGGAAPANGSTLLVQPAFFSQGGFASFTLKGIGLLTEQATPPLLIAAGTQLNPAVQNWYAGFNLQGNPTLTPVLLPVGQRNPISLAFEALGVADSFSSEPTALIRGDLVLGAGASIGTRTTPLDPLSQVAFTGDTVTILGSVYAPAGKIQVTGATDQTALQAGGLSVTHTVDLGPASVLSATGTVMQVFDSFGNLIGPVLGGGSITLNGDIMAEGAGAGGPGSFLDVSGASGTLKLPPAESGATFNSSIITQKSEFAVPTLVQSNGGLITIINGLFPMMLNATLSGSSGGASAQGGSLVISSRDELTPSMPDDVNLIVTPTNVAQVQPNISQFAATEFNGRGFDSLTLKGNVEFSGGVSVLQANASLIIGSGGFITVDSGSTANLTAPYVMLGQAFLTPAVLTPINVFSFQASPFYVTPQTGTGILNVTSTDLIDIGNLSLQSIDSATFASAHDIRGDGTLDAAGTINLTAGQIYAPTATTFNIVAYDPTGGVGTVNIASSGNHRALPYSAGSTLTVLASVINQGGVLNAPFGIINLGWNGVSTPPLAIDPLSGFTGTSLPITTSLTLAPGSVTSVSGVDPVTGTALTIPYGIIFNGVSWIDPRGVDITLIGPPAKAVNLSAGDVIDSAGAVVDVEGGGDLYAYQFVSGTGGSADFLAPTTSTHTQTSFAILPGYQADYAPVGAYDTDPTVAANFTTTVNDGGNGSVVQATDAGYTDSTLAVGDQVFLGGNGLVAGTYTLLPARYALLPGAFLVTPESSSATTNDTTILQPNGSNLLSGYRSSALNAARIGTPLLTTFEVDPTSLVRATATYKDSFGGSFFATAAIANNLVVPRLPGDSGQLVFDAASLQLMTGATVLSVPLSSTGLGGLVDIATSDDIFIYGAAQSALTVTGDLNLSVEELNSIGASSLLIGGIRQTSASGISVSATTSNIGLDNSGDPLVGPEIILVTAPASPTSASNLILDTGAQITQKGTLSGSAGETLLLGNSTPRSGNGNLLWITSNGLARVDRSGVTHQSPAPALNLMADAQLNATTLILDSTGQTTIDPTASLVGKNTSLDGSQITIYLSGDLPTFTGLLLTSAQLAALGSGGTLTLSSSGSIDIYGSGTIGDIKKLTNLSLQAAQIRGFDNEGDTVTGGGDVAFAAQNISLNNLAAATAPASTTIAAAGTLEFDADVLQLGGNALSIAQFGDVNLSATKNLLVEGLGNAAPAGTFSTSGNLTITTPLITTLRPAASSTPSTVSANATQTETLAAQGSLILQAPVAGVTTTTSSGLGASLTLSGTSITDNTNIQLASGSVSLTATTGDIQVGTGGTAVIDVGGTQQLFNDVAAYSNAGSVTLAATLGNINVGSGGTISVTANASGGSAGSITIAAPNGQFTATGTFHGKGGAAINGQAGANGSVSLDVGSLTSPLATPLTLLETNLADFMESFNLRVRTGDLLVTGLLKSHAVTLSADTGNIIISSTGTIDASYDSDTNFAFTPATATGGTIDLAASGNVTVNGSLTVEGKAFNDAGEGGAISLEAGTPQVVNGVITPGISRVALTGTSVLNLGVDATAGLNDFTGTLTLIAPQLDSGGSPIAAITSAQATAPVGVAVSSLAGSILGSPSSIAVVGNQLYQPAGGTINAALENAILNNGRNLLGAAGAASPGYANLFTGLFGNLAAGTKAVANIEVGSEIVNPTGALTLGVTTANTANDWILSGDRFGPNKTAGILTLRAAGDIILNNAISDGFVSSASTPLRDEPLLPASTLLPANNQSWSYRFAAGSDVGAADFHQVLSPSALLALNPSYNTTLGGPQGSLQLGATALPTGVTKTSPAGINDLYQVIRTGSGKIDIAAGGSIQFLSPYASIHTAGTEAPTLTDFLVPQYSPDGKTGTSAQYSLGGGDVTLTAQENIEHLAQVLNKQTTDSQLELPVNWLERRGTPGSATETTSWWIDFSNFFEGVGALGGGNVRLTAGNNLVNVDAVVPTNARLPEGSTSAADLVELGGGDLSVQTGNNIDGSVFYVERGQGTLVAGGSVTTNSGRVGNNQIGGLMPVTLFLGQGSFTINGEGSINLGSVANPFLLPENIDNLPLTQSYFSTYAASDAVNVSSLTGPVTLATETSTQTSFLDAWLTFVDTPDGPGSPAAANKATYLQIQEGPDIDYTMISTFFAPATMLLPPTLRAASLSSDIDIIGGNEGQIIGGVTLAPSPVGTLDLLADSSINALQVFEGGGDVFQSGTINLSDADPSAFPSVLSPIDEPNPMLNNFDSLLDETGSTQGSTQFKQALHTPGGLHANDPTPIHLYATTGSISGLTLFSGKEARVIAGTDLTDISLYLQNLHASDITIVAAGRDILPFDPNSPLQTESAATGVPQQMDTIQAGDIQIAGPGTLEVLAGRNLTLGDAPDGGDGTGLGITSIGNQRNPYLTASPGADVISGVGIGVSAALTNDGLANTAIHFSDPDPVNNPGFVDQFLNPLYGSSEAATYLPEVGAALGLTGSPTLSTIWNAFQALPKEQQDILTLNVFYQVLSDSGIAHNTPGLPTSGTYDLGKRAISALFPGATWNGSINLSSREIKTENGGAISLFAPGGGVALGSDITKPSADQGILTDEGGAINIFTSGNVDLGASRIFTLRGGNVVIWSSMGNIDAGASSKTVQAAPPTRVIVDPQTGNVQTDLAGLATGGGIGVLESKASVTASNVNLIAPVGTIDAGDAGIRASGKVNLAGALILNASNIQSGGGTTGAPTSTSVNVAGLIGASNVAGASSQAAQKLGDTGASSDINVQVLEDDGSNDTTDNDAPDASPVRDAVASVADNTR